MNPIYAKIRSVVKVRKDKRSAAIFNLIWVYFKFLLSSIYRYCGAVLKLAIFVKN